MSKLNDTHSNAVKDLADCFEADQDGRERAREADHFVNKRDGQWEPNVLQQRSDKPRYTFDKVSTIVSDLCGEINAMDFDIKVTPGGGAATAEIAGHYDGIIRTIETNGPIKAKYVYRAAGKQMITTGIGGWRVIVGYKDTTSFNQDLIIKAVSNFMDRVWFDPGAEERDMSDADYGFILTAMSLPDYKRDFPKGSRASISRDKTNNVYSQKKPDEVVVAERYIKKYENKELALMSNNAVYIIDDKFEKVREELSAKNISVIKTRKSSIACVYHQLLDGKDWLTDATKTVFAYVPLVPVFANFEISEDKVIYWGPVEKLMDPQRVLNYSESRRIEEGALAPRAKVWMTPKQASGHEEKLRTMNTNTDPVQFYNHVPEQPPPSSTPGAQINAGLKDTSEAMLNHIRSLSNRVDPSRPDAMAIQSGVALSALDRRSDNASYEYFNALEIGICHTARILIDAIPKVYDTKMEMRLTQQDGTTKTITINDQVFDEQTQKTVELNNLSLGQYNVTCNASASFDSRQQETAKAITEIAAFDPTIMELGSDVLLSNISAPGINILAKRKRARMVDAGLLLEEELTDEEKDKLEAKKQQPPQLSPMDQALIATAEAEAKKAEAETQDTMSKIEERQMKSANEMDKLALQNKQLEIKTAQEQQKMMLEMMAAQDAQLKALAETLKAIKDAMGVDVIMSKATTAAYEEQAELLIGAQVKRDKQLT